MFIGAALSSVLAAFQLAGLVQDGTFSLLQRPPVDKINLWGDGDLEGSSYLMHLPRLSLFRSVEDDYHYDTKSVNMMKCQIHGGILLIDYGEKGPEYGIDSCKNIAPFATRLTGQETMYDHSVGADARAPFSDEKRDFHFNDGDADTFLRRFERLIAIHFSDSTLSIVSGKAGAGAGADSGKLWYFGADPNYNVILLGTKVFPYVHKSRNDTRPFFQQEPFFLPAGRVVTLDATLLMPVHKLARHVDRQVDSSRARRRRGGYKKASNTLGADVCSSILAALQPTLHSVHDRVKHRSDNSRKDDVNDGINGHDYYLSRPFVLASSAQVGPTSGSVMQTYWLDYCGVDRPRSQEDERGEEPSLTPPRIFVATTPGGPQRFTLPDDDYMFDAYHPPVDDNSNISETGNTLGGRGSSCEAEQLHHQGKGPTEFKVRRACGSLHTQHSPFSSQSPCDIQRVEHLYAKAAPKEHMLCVEDVLVSKALHVEMQLPNDHEKKGEGKDSGVRAVDAWLTFASARGMADLSRRDPSFASSHNPFSHAYTHAGDFASREPGPWNEDGGHMSSNGNSGSVPGVKWWSRKARDIEDQGGPVGDFRGRRTRKLRSLHRVKDDAHDYDYVESDGLGTTGGVLTPSAISSRKYADSHMASGVHSTLAMRSTLDGRVEEFAEMMRILHAFANTHRTAAVAGQEDTWAPGRLRVTGLLSPLMIRAATAGVNRRLDPLLGASLERMAEAEGNSGKHGGRVRVQPLPVTPSRPVACMVPPSILNTITDTMAQLRDFPIPESNRKASSPTHWRILVDTLILTRPNLLTSHRVDPRAPESRFSSKNTTWDGGGVPIVAQVGGTDPVASGTPLAQPSPYCDIDLIAHGQISLHDRLLLLHHMYDELRSIMFDARNRSFLCQTQAGPRAYICRADERGRQAREYMAKALHDFTTLLSPSGSILLQHGSYMKNNVKKTAAQRIPNQFQIPGELAMSTLAMLESGGTLEQDVEADGHATFIAKIERRKVFGAPLHALREALRAIEEAGVSPSRERTGAEAFDATDSATPDVSDSTSEPPSSTTTLRASRLQGVNLRVSESNTLVFLVVSESQHVDALYLVDRWKKSCQGANTCFPYIHYHLVVLPTDKEDEEEERGRGAESANRPSAKDGSYSWSGELRRSSPASVRLTLLTLQDAVDRVALPRDVVVILHGLKAAMSFPAPGGGRNKIVPPVEYGQNAAYDLPAPLLYTPEDAFGRNCTSMAIVGLGSSIRRMIRTVRSRTFNSRSPGTVDQYYRGGSEGVRSAIYRYFMDESLTQGAHADVAQQYFHTKEARRRFHWMTVPDAMAVAKDKMLYLYPANQQNSNNQYDDIVDVTDFGGSANPSITLNHTFCELVAAMAARRVELVPHLADYNGERPFPLGARLDVDRWLWSRQERLKCNVQRSRLLILTWIGDNFPPPSNTTQEEEDAALQREAKAVASVVGIEGIDTPALWVLQEQRPGHEYRCAQSASGTMGYTNYTDEMTRHLDIPINPYGNGVFSVNFKALGIVVDALAKMMNTGLLQAVVSYSLQLHRAMSITFDGHGDTHLMDITLLKLAEVAKYCRHFHQYVPIDPYRGMINLMTEHMVGVGDHFSHLRHNPYSAWDYMATVGPKRKPAEEKDAILADSTSDSEYLVEEPTVPETPIYNSTIYDQKITTYNPEQSKWGERGNAMASRKIGSFREVPHDADGFPGLGSLVPPAPREDDEPTSAGEFDPHSHVSMLYTRALYDLEFQPASTQPLPHGEGRGPDAGPAPPLSWRRSTISGSLAAEKGAGAYWAVSQFHKDAPGGIFTPGASSTTRKVAPGINNTVWAVASDGGTGREALGNIFSVLSYTAQAGAYEVVGPYHSMINAYSKSIAHADYFTITRRRQLWRRQRRRQLHLWELSRIANGVDDRYSFPGKGARQDNGPQGDHNRYAPYVRRARRLLDELRNATSTSAKSAIHGGVRPFKTQFVTMASKDTPNLRNLIFSAELSGLSLHVVGMHETSDSGQNKENEEGASSFNYAEKIVAFYDYVVQALASKALLADDILVMVDAYDVLLLPAARRIGHYLYSESSTPILSCAENGVYPEGPSAFAYNHHHYRKSSTDDLDNLDQRFLNSGCIAGRVGQVFAMLQAAYDLRDTYRNDQQFYVRYHLTHPDVLSLDYGVSIPVLSSSGDDGRGEDSSVEERDGEGVAGRKERWRKHVMMFTTHKMASCSSTLLLSPSMTLTHSSYHLAPLGDGIKAKDGSTSVVAERVITDIGVLHGNNMASNRQYHVVLQDIKRFFDMHLTGADANGLIESIWAIADKDWAHAARLLSTASIQANFTSHGGTNLLGDLLLVVHYAELAPHLADIAMETGVCDSSRSRGNSRSAVKAPEDYLKHFSRIFAPPEPAVGLTTGGVQSGTASGLDSLSFFKLGNGVAFGDGIGSSAAESHRRFYSEWESALHCSYVVLEVIQKSLEAVNFARFKTGASQMAIEVSQLMASFKRSGPAESEGLASSASVFVTSDKALFMGAYGKGDVEAMEMLQHTLGSTGLEDYSWEPSGAVFVLQQQHFADALRKSIDKCT